MVANSASAKNVMKPHSEAKIRFYQMYLETYLRILISSQYVTEINIYDLFCGRGVYADGKTGSAIRAYETILKVWHDRHSDKRIVLHLNDKNKNHINSTRQYIEQRLFQEGQQSCEVVYSNEDASEMLKRLSEDAWKRSKRRGVRNFFFIDPYGYKHIRREFLEHLMDSGRSEIMLFLPISFMHRFTQHAFSENVTSGSLPLQQFLTRFFDESHPIRNEKIKVQEYIDYLTDAFSCGGKFFTASYPIERNESNSFALFFFSTHILGYENIQHLKWKMLDSWGFGFHQSAIQLNLFDDFFKSQWIEEKIESFRIRLFDFMIKENRTNGSIYYFTITNGFLPKHAKDVLRELQEENRLRIVDYHTGEIVNRKNQFKVDYGGYKNPKYLYQIKAK